MPTPPPSYTRIPLEQRKYTSIETEARLRRFLIDSVVYAYKVDTDALFKALPSGMATALSASDRDDFLELAEIINDASNNAVRNQISLISLDTISNISDHAIVPSRKLGVDPSCILCLLRMFSQHQGIYRHKVGFYIGQYRIIPFVGRYRKVREDLEVIVSRIVSDDLMVSRIAPNGETRLVQGNAIAQFSKKYWPRKKGDAP